MHRSSRHQRARHRHEVARSSGSSTASAAAGSAASSRTWPTCVDDLAFLMAMASKTNVHGPASYMMNTGFVLPGFPCMGAWISLRPGQPDRQPADVRRAARPARPAVQQRRQLLRRLPAGRPTRARSSSRTRRCPIADLFAADVGQVHHAGRARPTGWRCSSKLNREHLRPNARRLAARSPHRLLRAGRQDAARARPRCSTSPARPTRRSSSTASTTRPPPTSAATA